MTPPMQPSAQRLLPNPHMQPSGQRLLQDTSHTALSLETDRQTERYTSRVAPLGRGCCMSMHRLNTCSPQPGGCCITPHSHMQPSGQRLLHDSTHAALSLEAAA